MSLFNEENEVDLREVAYMLLVKKWLIISTVCLCVIISLGYSLSLPNIYEAKMKILIKGKQGKENNFGMVDALVGSFGLGGSGKSEDLLKIDLVLNSYDHTKDFLELNKDIPKDIFPEGDSLFFKEGTQDIIGYFKKKIQFHTLNEDERTLEYKINAPSKEQALDWLERSYAFFEDKMYKMDSVELAAKRDYLSERITITDNPKLKAELQVALAKEIQSALMLASNYFLIIEKPRMVERKIGPDRKLYILGGAVVGFIISIILIFLSAQYHEMKLFLKMKNKNL